MTVADIGNTELKMVTEGIASTKMSNYTTHGDIIYWQLVAVGQGLDETDRIGRSIRVLKVVIRAHIENHSGDASDNVPVDLWLLNDKRPGGALPSANTMFVDDEDLISRRPRSKDAGVEAADVNRLMVIKHAKANIGMYNNDATPPWKTITWYVPTDIRMVFDGTTDGLSDIVSNNILLAHRAIHPLGS